MAFLMVNRSMQIVDDLVYYFTCVNAVNADCYFMSCWRPRVSNCALCLWQWLVQMKGYLQIIFAVMCHIAWYGKELTECLWYCYMKQSMFATPPSKEDLVFIVGLQHLRGYLQIISSGHLFLQTDDKTWGPKMGCGASLTKLQYGENLDFLRCSMVRI